MDYQRHYDLLIQKSLGRPKPDIYVEQHHIVPRSFYKKNGGLLDGNPDEITNIVPLLPREHFIAHILLAKIYGGKMWHAAHMMSNMKKYSSRKYKIIREEHAKIISATQKGRSAPKGKDSPSFGLKRSTDFCAAVSARRAGVSNGLRSEETKQKMRDKRKLQTRTRDMKISVNGTIFPSATKAAMHIGISVSALCKRMRSGKYSDYYYL